MTGDQRRFRQLVEAALNLGMRLTAAEFYAREALAQEKKNGDWHITPCSAEALANEGP